MQRVALAGAVSVIVAVVVVVVQGHVHRARACAILHGIKAAWWWYIGVVLGVGGKMCPSDHDFIYVNVLTLFNCPSFCFPCKGVFSKVENE